MLRTCVNLEKACLSFFSFRVTEFDDITLVSNVKMIRVVVGSVIIARK